MGTINPTSVLTNLLDLSNVKEQIQLIGHGLLRAFRVPAVPEEKLVSRTCGHIYQPNSKCTTMDATTKTTKVSVETHKLMPIDPLLGTCPRLCSHNRFHAFIYKAAKISKQ